MAPFQHLRRAKLRTFVVAAAMLAAQPSAWAAVVGGIVFLLGLAVRIWAKGTLQRDSCLTVTGPYALCRHPYYLGNMLVDISILLLAGQPLLAILYVPMAMWVYRVAVRREEATLASWFPAEYGQVMRLPRYWPRWPRDWKALGTGWSAHRALIVEREATRTLRILSIPLLVFWACAVKTGGIWEASEAEGISLLLAAAMLNLVGHLLYRLVVRPYRRFRRSLRPACLSLGAVALAWAAVGFISFAEPQDVHALASEVGAHAVISRAADFEAQSPALPAGLYLIDDDIMETAKAQRSFQFDRVRTYWRQFEVYHLVRLNAHSHRSTG